MAKRVVPGSLTKAYQNKDRDFAPNLVGQQFTDPNSFFTLGNFSLTTNNSNITVSSLILVSSHRSLP